MKTFFFLIALLVSLNWAFCQNDNLIGKRFYDDSLHQIEFLGPSIMEYQYLLRTYEFKDRELIIYADTIKAHTKVLGSYAVHYNNLDTLYLSGSLKNNSTDTFKFISQQKRIIRIKNFDKFVFEYEAPLSSNKFIITKDRKVTFPEMIIGQPYRLKTVTLSKIEFDRLLDTLGKSLFFMIPNRSCIATGFDAGICRLEFISNGQTILRTNPCFAKIHWEFYKYLRHRFQPE